jgi:hypothetical protein
LVNHVRHSRTCVAKCQVHIGKGVDTDDAGSQVNS